MFIFRHKHTHACARVVQFVADIRELFDEIDINGDGDLEWEEFTAYCANLGFVATKHKVSHTETRKVRALAVFFQFWPLFFGCCI